MRRPNVTNEEDLRWAEHSHGERFGYKRNDYATFPAGAEGAHQLVDTSGSTMVEPEVSVYPDSGKVGVLVGSAPGGPKEERTLSGHFRQEDGVGYYGDED